MVVNRNGNRSNISDYNNDNNDYSSSSNNNNNANNNDGNNNNNNNNNKSSEVCSLLGISKKEYNMYLVNFFFIQEK